MKRTVQQLLSPLAAAGHRGRPAALLAGAVLLWWTHLVLGSNLPWLLTAIAAPLIAVLLLRHHRGVAVCAAIAALTAAVPAVTCVVLVDRQVPGASAVVAVLTGYILAAPVPALAAAAQSPAVVPAPGNALRGSGVLLLGAIPSVVFGDHGEGALVLVLALTSSVALIWHRSRRAAADLLAPLPLVNGWTDLGRRTLPDGTLVEQLLIGHGQAITCTTALPMTTHQDSALHAARAAAVTATALGLTGSRVQPVLLSEHETPYMGWRLVNDGEVAASVIVTARRNIQHVTRLAPHRRRHQRRAVLTGALLPTTAGTTR